eukprot:7587631-Karenia_brevis.AAC.1
MELARKVTHSSKWEYNARRCAIQAATGKYTIASVLIKFQLAVEPECPLCGVGVDSVFHRCWECQALREQRAQICPERVVTEARREGQGSCLYSMGIPVSQVHDIILQSTTCARWRLADGQELGEHEVQFTRDQGPVFCDGSCYMPTHAVAAHAGWACVQIDATGAIVKVLYGCLPQSHDQTAVNAEHAALLHAGANAAEPIECILDCQAVICNYTSGYREAAAANKAQAGYWRELKRAKGWEKIASITKIQAHQDADEAQLSEEDRHRVRGNNAADEWAKAGAKIHAGQWKPS